MGLKSFISVTLQGALFELQEGWVQEAVTWRAAG